MTKRVKKEGSLFENDLIRKTYSRNNLLTGLCGTFVVAILSSIMLMGTYALVGSTFVEMFLVSGMFLLLLIQTGKIIFNLGGLWKHTSAIIGVGIITEIGMIIGIGIAGFIILIAFPIFYTFWNRN